MAEQKKLCPTFSLYAPSDLSKKWFVHYYQDGKRVRKYGSINKFSTAEERHQAAAVLIAELSREVGEQQNTIKKQLLDRLQIRKEYQRPKTVRTYRSKINMLFDFLETDNPGPEDIRRFFEHLHKTKAASTYTRYLVDLKAFFKEIDLGAYFEGIEKRRYRHTPKRYFQTYQIDRLRGLIKADPELWLCVQLLYYCFIRPRETRFLRAGDFLLDEQKILLRGEISKNKKTEYVAIPGPLVAELQFIRELPPNTVLFPGQGSVYIGENTFYNRHRQILRKLGFSTEYSLYSWKHTGVVSAVKAGISVKELQIQLRHHSLDQVDQYLRQLGVNDLANIRNNFPEL